MLLLTHFLRIVRAVMRKGAETVDLLPQTVPILLFIARLRTLTAF